MNSIGRILIVTFSMISIVSTLSAQSSSNAAVGATIVTPVTVSQPVIENNIEQSYRFLPSQCTDNSGPFFIISGPRDLIFSVTLHNSIAPELSEKETPYPYRASDVAYETGTLVDGTQKVKVNSLVSQPGAPVIALHSTPSPFTVMVNFN